MNIDAIAIFITKALIGIMETFLGVRFFLKILGASQQASFVRWVYATTDSIMEPFIGMFPSPSLGPYFIIELNAIFAMIVYALVGYFIIRVIDFVYKQFILNFQNADKPQEHVVKKEEAKGV